MGICLLRLVNDEYMQALYDCLGDSFGAAGVFRAGVVC